MLKTVMVHGQTLRVFGKLMAGISLAACLTGCGKINKADSPQTTQAWTTKKVANTKAKTISDWVNKPGKRTKVSVYSSIPDVAGVVATANMQSGYVNRVYKYKSPAILDNYYFSYVFSNTSVKKKPFKYVVFKSANIDGVQVSKNSGSFNNAVVYVSKSMIAKENALAKKAFAEENALAKKESKESNKESKKSKKTKDKNKNKTTTNESPNTYSNNKINKDLEAYSKYRDSLYNTLLKALGLAASNNSYKMTTVK